MCTYVVGLSTGSEECGAASAEGAGAVQGSGSRLLRSVPDSLQSSLHRLTMLLSVPVRCAVSYLKSLGANIPGETPAESKSAAGAGKAAGGQAGKPGGAAAATAAGESDDDLPELVDDLKPAAGAAQQQPKKQDKQEKQEKQDKQGKQEKGKPAEKGKAAEKAATPAAAAEKPKAAAAKKPAAKAEEESDDDL